MLQEQLPGPCVFSAVELSLERPSDVALLIGEKGQSIRKIQQETNAKVVTRPREVSVHQCGIVASAAIADVICARRSARVWLPLRARRTMCTARTP